MVYSKHLLSSLWAIFFSFGKREGRLKSEEIQMTHPFNVAEALRGLSTQVVDPEDMLLTA